MANKQSSSRASTVAARVLQPSYPSTRDDVIRDARLLAGSVLSQDEHKGQQDRSDTVAKKKKAAPKAKPKKAAKKRGGKKC